MTTIRDGISRVRSMNKLVSQDNLISDRMIRDEILSSSSLLIKRETNLRRLWNSPNLFSNIKCLKMTAVPLSECCDYVSPCNISRSVCKIPKIEEGLYSLLIRSVSSIDGGIQFKEGNAERFANSKELALKSKPYMYWVQNDYLYVTEVVEALNFSAYFSDEENELDTDDCVCNGKQGWEDDCKPNPLDKTWKIPSYLEDSVISMVHEKINQLYFRHTNDMQSDITKEDQR